MPLPFLPLLGAAARVLGGGAMARMAFGGMGGMLKATKPVDVLALGRQLGTPNPSQQQIKAAQLANVGNAAAGATKALLGLPVAASAIVSAFEAFGAAILSSREQFAQFNTGIAHAFAGLKLQDLTLATKTGAGISGTTQSLASSFAALREDTQPMKEAMLNLWNVAGIAVVQIARGIVGLLKITGLLVIVESINDIIKRWFGSTSADGIAGTLYQQMQDIREMKERGFRDDGEQPKNKRPGINDPGWRPDPADRHWGM